MFLYSLFRNLNNYIASFLQLVYLSLMMSLMGMLHSETNPLNYEDVAQPKLSLTEIAEMKQNESFETETNRNLPASFVLTLTALPCTVCVQSHVLTKG